MPSSRHRHVKTRLAERITYLILARTLGPHAYHAGITIVNIVLAAPGAFIDGADGDSAAGMPQHLALYGTGITPNSLSIPLADHDNATIGAGILTATVPNPVTAEFVAKASGHHQLRQWLMYGFPRR